MRIDHPLLKLPVRFCADTLAREVAALPAEAWVPHPTGFKGNEAVRLVSVGGGPTDEFRGPMAPTDFLWRCPYIVQIMHELDSTWGRSRLMGLGPGADVPSHVDIHYYWRTHLRIHIPVITNPDVAFTCGGDSVHMKAGECWLLDSFFRHSVHNGGQETRIHLVLDTIGSAHLWDLIDRAATATDEPEFVSPGPPSAKPLDFEQINAPDVMSPWEMKAHVAYLLGWIDDEPHLLALQRGFDRFLMAWSGAWARYGTSDEGLPTYLRLLSEIDETLAKLCDPPIMMRNEWGFRDSMRRFVLDNAISPAKLQRMQGSAARSRLSA